MYVSAIQSLIGFAVLHQAWGDVPPDPVQDQTNKLFYDGYRVNIDQIPTLVDIPINVSWHEIKYLKRMTSSAAYDFFRGYFNGQEVVVKQFRNQTIKKSRSGAAKEMEKEIMVLSRLRHPNILNILGSGYLPHRFMILEYLGGGTLSRMLNYTYRDHANYGVGRLSQETAFKYAISLAEALVYIHEHWHPLVRLFHRDLKSDNIAFTSSGQLKLFDFGLCELIRRAKLEDMAFRLSTGVGSWRYTAPEVLSGDSYNHKSDVFGFGVILYHMLSGKHPIPNSVNRTAHATLVVEKGWRAPLKFGWPQRLNRLIARSWNYDPFARPNMIEVLAELKRINENYPDIWKQVDNGVRIGSTYYVQ